MTTTLRAIKLVTLALTLVAAGFTTVSARQSTQRTPLPISSYKLDVVLARYQGDKKISNMPFVLYGATSTTSSTARMSLRLGVDVPVGSATVTRGTAAPNNTSSESSTSTQVNYRNVGTQIDCYVTDPNGGIYPVQVNIQDSSIFNADDVKGGLKLVDPMAFRTFSFVNTLPMKDGQTIEFVSAVDKISGEVLKVTLTFTVVK